MSRIVSPQVAEGEFVLIQESILPGVVEELVPGANVGGPFKERVRRRISGESV
jgi:hypothetical protein